jgi:hypothetical protein
MFVARLRFVPVDASAPTNRRHVQTAIEAMRTKADGALSSAASLNTYIAAVKAFLGFAHTVGYTRFNAAPLIRLKKAPEGTPPTAEQFVAVMKFISDEAGIRTRKRGRKVFFVDRRVV